MCVCSDIMEDMTYIRQFRGAEYMMLEFKPQVVVKAFKWYVYPDTHVLNW